MRAALSHRLLLTTRENQDGTPQPSRTGVRMVYYHQCPLGSGRQQATLFMLTCAIPGDVLGGDSSNSDIVLSHLMTTQQVAVHIGRLNRAAVEGLWASLHLELLYLANDDDERYSIQAHPTLLRNLTVQSADPPLGYPIMNRRIALQTA